MQLSNYILAQRCPRSWWGGTSLSTNFLDLMFSAPSERCSAPTRRHPRTEFPQWGSRRVDAYQSVDPKTLSRPRAVKTDRKSFSFFLFSSLRAFLKFRFSFKVTKTTILMSYLFSSVPSYHKNAIFLKLQVDYACISFLLPHKTNVSVFSTAFENTFEIITGTSQPI